MRAATGPKPPLLHNHRGVAADTNASFHFFVECIKHDPRLRGRVLDVGCSEWPGYLQVEVLFPLFQLPASMDGVDPFPGVRDNPWIENAFQGEVEKADIPQEAYDAAISINVVEHLKEPEGFLRGVFRALKPGGVYYAITPHARHPFAWCVRLIETLRIKKHIAAHNETINDYPAYYRLNSRSSVETHGAAAGFDRATVYFHPHTSWRRHLPRPIRPLGWLYDACIGMHVLGAGNQFMLALEKPGVGAGTVIPPRTSRVRFVGPQDAVRAETPRHTHTSDFAQYHPTHEQPGQEPQQPRKP